MNIVFIIAVISALCLCTAAWIGVFPSVAAAVLGDDRPSRVRSLDGLRGLLALFVFVHHSIILHGYYGGRPWEAPQSNIENLLGRGSVAVFFMISAYLFWGRVVRADGRLRWREFFRGRVLRLMPLYYTAIALLFLIVAADTGFVLRVPVRSMLLQIVRWSSFSFLGSPAVNGVMDTATILSTLWSLRYEWLFYFSLPLFAWLYRATRRSTLPIYVAVFALSLMGGELTLIEYFAIGGLSVDILRKGNPRRSVRWAWAGAGGLALVILCLCFHDEAGPVQALLLLPVFVASLYADGPWAVLRWRPVRFLGHISYSVYLLHNPLLHIFSTWIPGLNYGSLPQPLFYGVVLLMGVGVVAVSTTTFLFIEKPFLTETPRERTVALASTAVPNEA